MKRSELTKGRRVRYEFLTGDGGSVFEGTIATVTRREASIHWDTLVGPSVFSISMALAVLSVIS